ncbi:MAG: trypsin-like peptidase domain-containing protein, partial [Aggregatilineales bacterium]
MRNSINTNNLQETVVKIIINGKPVSTGFWAAPNCIITCAHSVEGEVTDLKVEWNNQVFPGLLDWKSDRDYPDLALIKVNIDSHPIVTLSEEVMIGDALYIFGYPLSPTNPIKLVSTGVTAIFESVSFLDKAKEQILLSFKEAQVSVGMSGSPLLNRQTGKVCGVVKSSRNEFTNMGGRATPSELIIANIPEIALFHNEQKKKSQRDLFEHFIDNPYQDILSPPFEWIFIPTGKVSINESLSDEGSWYEVPKFAISKYPITRNQYSNFVKEGGYENNRFWSDDQLHRWYIKNKLEYSWYNKSISGNCPQTDISYWEALAFC